MVLGPLGFRVVVGAGLDLQVCFSLVVLEVLGCFWVLWGLTAVASVELQAFQLAADLFKRAAGAVPRRNGPTARTGTAFLQLVEGRSSAEALCSHGEMRDGPPVRWGRLGEVVLPDLQIRYLEDCRADEHDD